MTPEKLDPHVRSFLEDLESEGGPPLETFPPVEARKLAADLLHSFGGEPETVGSISDLSIPGPAGEIPVRVYSPEGSAPWPGLVFFHGGGWVLCDLDTHHVICTALARRAKAVVVSVDYRLAPEHRYPAAVEDAYAALKWVAKNAEQLGINPERIAVAGESAGGNLAAVVCLKSRDEAGPRIALQALVYPVTNLAAFETDSYREFADGYFLTRAQMEWFRSLYLRDSSDATHPDASPLLAPDLRGLPPALVITAECDPLRDEGEAYGRRLEEAGVRVTCTRYAGMIHPFFALLGAIPRGWDAIQQVADAVRGASG
jgi:acetyl esterase